MYDVWIELAVNCTKISYRISFDINLSQFNSITGDEWVQHPLTENNNQKHQQQHQQRKKQKLTKINFQEQIVVIAFIYLTLSFRSSKFKTKHNRTEKYLFSAANARATTTTIEIQF